MMRRFLRRLSYLFRSRRMDAELRDEMDFHRAMLAHRGLGEDRFGNATLAREDARGVWIWWWLEDLRQDIRYGARSLWRDKAFTLTALGALGAAIGLNVSLFTTFNGVMLRRWPVPESGRVVTLVNPAGPIAFSLAEYARFAEGSRSFEGLIVTRCLDGVSSGCTVQMDDTPLEAEFVSANYFDVLHLPLARGAGFHVSDAPTSPAVAIISDALWRTRFASDPAVVGRALRLDDVPFTIVGVAPQGFWGTQVTRTKLWIPLAASAALRPDALFDDTKRFGIVSGRLAAGVSRARAEAEATALSRQFHAGERDSRDGDRLVHLVDATSYPGQGRRSNALSVFGLMGIATALVLALACANVGNLLLARAAARRREIAVRLAIGASRLRVFRQLLTECMLISAIAAVIGIALAYRLPRLVLAQVTEPLAFRLEPDLSALAYALAVAVAACVGFGLTPAWHGSGEPPRMLSFGRTAAPPLRLAGLPLRSLLLAAQVAIAVVLLISAGLLVRGVSTAAAGDPGFDMHDISVVSFELPASYESTRVRAFARQIVDRTTPPLAGSSFGFADTVPFGVGGRPWIAIAVPGRQSGDVLAVDASPGYMSALGIPILLGRTFEPGDARAGNVLINESLARQFWPDASPLGQVLTAGSPRRVIGVVKDVRHYPFAIRATLPTIYVPFDGRTVPQLLVRHLEAGTAQVIAEVAREIEPRARVTVAPLEDQLAARLTQSRVAAGLAAGVGLLGLVLATLGVFSVFAYSVEQRRAEIGIRIALGAGPKQILRTIVGSGGGSLGIGLTVGLAAAFAVARVLRRFLYGLSPADPLTYAGIAVVLATAALAATLFPARRAMRIDPVIALRSE